MSSRRASTKPYIFGAKKAANQATISPKNPLSASGFLDVRASIMGRGERINTTEVYRSNSPNRLKDISNSIVNSSIDAKGQDQGISKFSFIKMLAEKKCKDITEVSTFFCIISLFYDFFCTSSFPLVISEH